MQSRGKIGVFFVRLEIDFTAYSISINKDENQKNDLFSVYPNPTGKTSRDLLQPLLSTVAGLS